MNLAGAGHEPSDPEEFSERLLVRYRQLWEAGQFPSPAPFLDANAASPDEWECLPRLLQVVAEHDPTGERVAAELAALRRLRDLPAWIVETLAIVEDEHRHQTRCDALGAEQRFRSVQEFTIHRFFKEGGSKKVFAANHANFGGTPVAFKVPRTSSRNAKLLEEARVLARIAHQNVPSIRCLEDGTSPPGMCFLIEEWIEGATWEELLRDEWEWVERLPAERRAAAIRELWRRHLEMLLVVCQPVRFTHATFELIHGDLKPDNVRLRRREPLPDCADRHSVRDYGEVFVCDWGEAVHVAETADSTITSHHRSRIDVILGTPGYRSPGIDGHLPTRLCPQTDVYALGAILYRIVTGLAPPEVRSLEEQSRCSLEARGVVVPPELTAIYRHASHFFPELRFDSVADFSRAVERFLRHADAESRMARIGEQIRDWSENVSPRVARSPAAIVAEGIALAEALRQASLDWLAADGAADLTVVVRSRRVPQTDEPALNVACSAESEARRRVIELALVHGDFTLAENETRSLEELPGADARQIAVLREAIWKGRRRRNQLRCWGALAVPVLFVAFGWGVAEHVQRKADQELAAQQRTADLLIARTNEALLAAQTTKARAEAEAAKQKAQREESEKKNAETLARQESERRRRESVFADRLKYSALFPDSLAVRSLTNSWKSNSYVPSSAERLEVLDWLQRSLVPVRELRKFAPAADKPADAGEASVGAVPFRQATRVLQSSRDRLVRSSAGGKPRLQGLQTHRWEEIPQFANIDWEDDAFAVALSPSHDGTRLAVVLHDGRVLIFDIASGRRLTERQVQTISPAALAQLPPEFLGVETARACFPVINAAWSPDDRQLTTLSFQADKPLRASELRHWNALDFAPAGDAIPLDGLAGTLTWTKVLDQPQLLVPVVNSPTATDGPGRGVLQVHADGNVTRHRLPTTSINAMALSDDGRLLALAGEGEVMLWERPTNLSESWQLNRTLFVFSQQDSPNPWHAEQDGVVPREVHRLKANKSSVLSVAVSPDRQFVAATSGAGSLQVVSITSGEVIGAATALPSADLLGHNVATHFNRIGELFTTDTHGSVKQWEFVADRLVPSRLVDTGYLLGNLVAQSDRHRIHVSRFQDTLHFGAIDPANPSDELVAQFQLTIPQAEITNITTIPGTQELLAYTKAGDLYRVQLDVGSFRKIASTNADVRLGNADHGAARPPKNHVNDTLLVLNEDASLAAVMPPLGGILAVDLRENKALAMMATGESVFDAMFRPGRPRELAILNGSGHVQLISVDQPGRVLRQFGPLSVDVAKRGRLLFTPRGEQLLAETGGQFRTFEIPSSSTVSTQQLHFGFTVDRASPLFVVRTILDWTFLGDGRLATLGNDQRLRLWHREVNSAYKLQSSISLMTLRTRQYVSSEEETASTDPRLADYGYLVPVGKHHLIVGSILLGPRIVDVRAIDEASEASAEKVVELAESLTGWTVNPANRKVRFDQERVRPVSLPTPYPVLQVLSIAESLEAYDRLNRAGDLRACERLLTETLEIFPEDRICRAKRSSVRRRLKDFDGALDDCSRELPTGERPRVDVDLVFASDDEKIARRLRFGHFGFLKLQVLALREQGRHEESVASALLLAARARLDLVPLAPAARSTLGRDYVEFFQEGVALAKLGLAQLGQRERAARLEKAAAAVLGPVTP